MTKEQIKEVYVNICNVLNLPVYNLDLDYENLDWWGFGRICWIEGKVAYILIDMDNIEFEMDCGEDFEGLTIKQAVERVIIHEMAHSKLDYNKENPHDEEFCSAFEELMNKWNVSKIH